MYLKVTFVALVVLLHLSTIVTATTTTRRQRFLNAARCAFTTREDLSDGAEHPVFLFSSFQGFLSKNEQNQGFWVGHHLLSDPIVHRLSCSNSNSVCSIYVDSEGDDRKLFVTITSDRQIWYSEAPSNVIVKFYRRRKVLVFFDRQTRRYRLFAYPILLSKIRHC